MMDDLMRAQLSNAQTSFARRRQNAALPGNGLPASAGVPDMADPQAMHGVTTLPNGPAIGPQTWLLHPPGQPAPRQHFNFEPQGNGAWRIYPPGVQAPAHGPQGTLPAMPPSFEHIQRLGGDLHRTFGPGGGQAPPVPGPFPTAPPAPRPGAPTGPAPLTPAPRRRGIEDIIPGIG